jgi:nucleotide-binding universal stress UspA family protein
MYRRILVGVAKTESARRAVDVALDLAERYDAELHLVMAFDRGGGGGRDPRQDAEGHLASIQKLTSVGTRIHVLPGDPADIVLTVADEVKADLIVVGNKGMHGARRILGSVPNSVAHGAGCSVLIADTTREAAIKPS